MTLLHRHLQRSAVHTLVICRAFGPYFGPYRRRRVPRRIFVSTSNMTITTCDLSPFRSEIASASINATRARRKRILKEKFIFRCGWWKWSELSTSGLSDRPLYNARRRSGHVALKVSAQRSLIKSQGGVFPYHHTTTQTSLKR